MLEAGPPGQYRRVSPSISIQFHRYQRWVRVQNFCEEDRCGLQTGRRRSPSQVSCVISAAAGDWPDFFVILAMVLATREICPRHTNGRDEHVHPWNWIPRSQNTSSSYTRVISVQGVCSEQGVMSWLQVLTHCVGVCCLTHVMRAKL